MQITGETDLFYIVGSPVTHFRALSLFNEYFEKKGHDFCAAALHIPKGQLEAAFKTVRLADNIKGLCITIPHKIDAVPLVDRLTETAERIGSVNYVRREPDGTLTGHNLDGQGFLRGMAANGVNLAGAEVLQVGVGGVGRAIAFSLATSGISKLVLVNRSVEKATRLASELSSLVRVEVLAPMEIPNLSRTALLVNATSVGMVGNAGMPIDISGILPECTVADVVLKPLETDLLAQARSMGCKCVPGTATLMPQIELCEEFLYH